MKIFRLIAVSLPLLSITVSRCQAEEQELEFYLNEGEGIQVCEALLASARRVPEKIIGQCDRPPPSRPNDAPARYLDWASLRDTMHPGFFFPEWQELDVSLRRNLEMAYFMSAFSTDLLIKYNHAKHGYTVWHEVLTDDEMQFLVRRYLDEGELPSDFMLPPTELDIGSNDKFYWASFKYGGSKNEVMRSDLALTNRPAICFEERDNPWRKILLFDGRNVAQSLQNSGFRSDQAYSYDLDDIMLYGHELYGVRYGHVSSSGAPGTLFVAPYSRGAGFARFDDAICHLRVRAVQD